MKNYKIAIVHDYLCGMGGSERVFSYMCEEFKEADIFTLAYNPELTLPEFKVYNINVTWLNKFVRNMSQFRWSFPIATYVMQEMRLGRYDIVLTSSATVAKYVRAKPGRHICYSYIPTRALWQSDIYFANNFKSKLIKPFKRYLQKRDLEASSRVEKFIAISENTRLHIKNIYKRDSHVIYSPIVCDNFCPVQEKGDFYLLVSRLETWKMLEHALIAFNKNGKNLKIIGTGSDENRLKRLSQNNIEFLGAVDDDKLSYYYSTARSVIFTPELEYGLIPLEANASGTPVICFGRGGVNETMVAYDKEMKNEQNCTALFYYDQTPEALNETIRTFEKLSFNQTFMVDHAQKWDVSNFKSLIRTFVDDFYTTEIIDKDSDGK